jgi:hypothetical protein
METLHRLIVTKALRTYIRIYPLLKSEQLSAKSKVTLYKALLGSKMTYAFNACKIRVLHTTGNLPRRTPTRALLRVFSIPDVYIYITKKQAEVIQTHDTVNVRNLGKNEAQHRNIKGSELVAVRHTIVQESKLP